MPRVPPRLTANARALRKEATDAERRVWEMLKECRPRFTRQLVVGSYILDFACRTAKLAVEFDGIHHENATGYDGQRTRFLESIGWRVIRFWNTDFYADPHAVVQEILRATRERLTSPLPAREDGAPLSSLPCKGGLGWVGLRRQ